MPELEGYRPSWLTVAGGGGANADAYPVKKFVIDLIAANDGPVPVAQLVDTGQMFGYTEGSVRVCLSRMVAAGTLAVEGVNGWSAYGFTETAARFNQRLRDEVYLDQRRPWDGTFRLVAFTCASDRRDARQRLLDRLEREHFRALHRGLWGRPNNVALDLGPAVEGFGDAGVVDVFVGRPERPERLVARTRELWSVDALEAAIESQLTVIAESRRRLGELPPEEALIESFKVGSSSFRLAARDPLLPFELLPAGWAGEELRREVADYNHRACDLWSDYSSDRWPAHAPAAAPEPTTRLIRAAAARPAAVPEPAPRQIRPASAGRPRA